MKSLFIYPKKPCFKKPEKENTSRKANRMNDKHGLLKEIYNRNKYLVYPGSAALKINNKLAGEMNRFSLWQKKIK
ncbi:MAG: hypothetical protein J7604_18460 [Sporocytophaga sp.]|uniref:hypothetical protein n=1 Tax=Sporocytophaga sp. TaxID=2231183 RepID=UPI001B12166E|nr:hypothetical protein [Sporocytophaga sp.]MBO9702198.1 hypothetical protein [Sporocytophaga sp.]